MSKTILRGELSGYGYVPPDSWMTKPTDAEDAAGVTVVDYQYEPGNVLRYGAVADGATDNRAAFAKAVSAAPAGGTVTIPPAALSYLVDTSGGESSAVAVNKRLTIVIDGAVKASFSAIQANPPTIFLVSGDNVTFTGTGKLIGDGTFNQVNTGTNSTFPSLVKVTGDYFTMTGLTIEDPWKIGVFLYDCTHGKIQGNNFAGGATTYSDTAHFGIRTYAGGRHIISGNQFYPNGSGGMFVQCIFTSDSNHCLIDANVAYRPYEKLAYIGGTYNVISNNVVVGNTGTVPGTSHVGTVGSPLRHDGIFGKITNNLVYYCGAGISSIGGGGLTIEGNSFLSVGQSAIAVFDGGAVLDYLSIRNNVCVGGELAGITTTNGILVRANLGTSFYFDISHNQVKGFAPAAGSGAAGIWVEGASGVQPNERCIISHNNIGPGSTACRIGIYLDHVTQSIISNNRMRCSVYSIQESNGAYNRYLYNSSDSTGPVGIQGLNAASYGEGNTYDVTLPLIADVTLPGGGVSTYTVPSSTLCVAANAKALLSPANISAAAYLAANGLYATISSPNVVLTSGGSPAVNFAGTEIFTVRIIQ